MRNAPKKLRFRIPLLGQIRKFGKLLLFRKLKIQFIHNSRGQTVVEFVLLLVVMTSISFAFVKFINKNLGSYWEYSANLVINDKPGTKTVQLE